MERSARAVSHEYKKLIIRATNFPGITSRVTETLAKCGLNIEALRMDTKMSPFNQQHDDEDGNGGRRDVLLRDDGATHRRRVSRKKKDVEKYEEELS